MMQRSSMKSRLRALPSLKGPFPEFDPDSLSSSPHDAFSDWLDDAINRGVTEPHAMTLSTVDQNGHPDARVLILKDVDARGWHFSTKGHTPKGSQIDAQSTVALTFYWAQLGRQVRIRGKAVQLSSEECVQDFRNRPESSKVSALASKQSQLLDTRQDVLDGLDAAQKKLRDDPGYVSDDWKVFAVNPDSIEFWQGASDRLHWRVVYTRNGDGKWSKHMLWP